MLNTIPIDTIVSVTPGILPAGGEGLVLQGLMLTQNMRVPIGSVLSFPNAAAVATYFGSTSIEYAKALVYFNGFDNSNIKPGSILVSQYNQTAVSAYLRGANVSALTLAQLQAISGTLTVIVDGYAHTAGSLNLTAANSFSSAASIIQTALNASLAQAASVTGSIAASTASVTGSIAGNILTVTAVSSGTLVSGCAITGTGVTANTVITSQLSGTIGGIGTYAVNNAQIVASETISATYGTMTVTAVSSGVLAVGNGISGTGVTVGTVITSFGSGTGGTGTYIVNLTQTASSTTLTANAIAVSVAYDSVSGAFIITSGITGAASTIAFATGSTAATLGLTSATGAVVSQGANAIASPAAGMNAIIAMTTNWATFFTAFDPDGGSGNTQKLAFATWNGQQNNGYAYVCWDTDITPTLSAPATGSLGYLISQAQISGTILIYEPSDLNHGAFVSGAFAAVDFNEENGRITMAFKSQSGLVPGVTNATAAANLLANGYNFYGIYAAAEETDNIFYNGSISGAFKWADAYLNEIWLNSDFQLSIFRYLKTVKSMPYNPTGYAGLRHSMADTIDAGLNFGMFGAGTVLSQAQIAEVMALVGKDVSQQLQSTGWYLQILPASPSVRAARGSPPCIFLYCDNGSIQAINLSSLSVQ